MASRRETKVRVVPQSPRSSSSGAPTTKPSGKGPTKKSSFTKSNSSSSLGAATHVSKPPLSEREVLQRQRYVNNSSFASAQSQLSNLIQMPPKHSTAGKGGRNNTVQLREFILEQRKIIASFRSQPWPMYMKIEAIRNYKANILNYVPQLGTIDAFRDKSSRAVYRERQRLKSILRTLTIWRYIIKKIEGNFGTSVGSYFRLVRWLCVLNFSTFLLIFLLVIMPQVLFGHGLDIPAAVRGNVSALSFFFDGEGYLFEYSILFYGFYDSGQNESYVAPPYNPQPYIRGGYKLPMAYILVMIFIFVISGGAILYSISKKYKIIQRSKLGKEEGQYIFAWRVFAGWDYAITDPKTAETKMKQHGIALKETLFEATKTRDMSSRAKIQRYMIHAVTNSIVTILLFGSGYAIFVAAENANSIGGNNFNLSDLGFDNLLHFFRSFQLQIVIVLRNFLIPLLFKFIALHEKYHPRTALKIRLLRLFVLYFSSLYVVMISLFILSRNCQNRSQEGTCRCWETNVGQEMYKLMLIQTVTEVGSILLVEGSHWFFSKVVSRYCKTSSLAKLVGNVEFETSVSVLKLVYGQGLILFGVLFCPFLPAIGFMRNILVFYLRTVAVFVFDSPPHTFFRVASTHNFYMAILLVTVFISSLPVGFAMIEMTPSLRCGPFRGLDSMVSIISNDVNTWPTVVQTVLDYIQTATIILPVITALCVVIYYYASLANALKEVNKDLLLQLTVEQSETRKILAEQVASDRRAKIMENVALQASVSGGMAQSLERFQAHSASAMQQASVPMMELRGSHSAATKQSSIFPIESMAPLSRLSSSQYVDALVTQQASRISGSNSNFMTPGPLSYGKSDSAMQKDSVALPSESSIKQRSDSKQPRRSGSKKDPTPDMTPPSSPKSRKTSLSSQSQKGIRPSKSRYKTSLIASSHSQSQYGTETSQSQYGAPSESQYGTEFSQSQYGGTPSESEYGTETSQSQYGTQASESRHSTRLSEYPYQSPSRQKYGTESKYGGTSHGRTSHGRPSLGGTSHGGTSLGGTSHGGTSHGGTSLGGTSHGSTSHGGTSHGGTSHSQYQYRSTSPSQGQYDMQSPYRMTPSQSQHTESQYLYPSASSSRQSSLSSLQYYETSSSSEK